MAKCPLFYAWPAMVFGRNESERLDLFAAGWIYQDMADRIWGGFCKFY
jgi:hypothetical protein